MRSLIHRGLVAVATLCALPLAAHPHMIVRGGFWIPRPFLIVRPAPVCLEPAPVVVFRNERACEFERYGEVERYYRHGRRRHW